MRKLSDNERLEVTKAICQDKSYNIKALADILANNLTKHNSITQDHLFYLSDIISDIQRNIDYIQERLYDMEESLYE